MPSRVNTKPLAISDLDTTATQNDQLSAASPFGIQVGQGSQPPVSSVEAVVPGSSVETVAEPALVPIAPGEVPPIFRGTINIPGHSKCKEETLQYCYSKPRAAEDHVPTPDNIEVNLFVDGSYHPVTSDGGYAIVFKRFVHGSVTRQEVVQFVFQMKPGINSMIAEASALAEALVRGKKEIVRTITALVAENPGPLNLNRILPRRIVLGIFSDSRDNLDVLQKAKWPPRDACRAKLLHRCVVESYNVLDIPEFPSLVVDLRASWVLAHRREYLIVLHTFADQRAGEARKRGSFGTVGYEEHAISDEDSVVAPLQRLFYTQATATNTMKLARVKNYPFLQKADGVIISMFEPWTAPKDKRS
ncbi:hypothetical protein B0T18DRAFT_428470 [Schizothecium vesticola]|uniref:Uncharacterized protein n=1 Tax=Schizothecium vesticola TaxID=314040 RepID=A0AA40K9N0_9PEZI|nr:hypothetical protein B0T18DRAFT_428470 [Schizothecium vesticola]